MSVRIGPAWIGLAIMRFCLMLCRTSAAKYRELERREPPQARCQLSCCREPEQPKQHYAEHEDLERIVAWSELELIVAWSELERRDLNKPRYLGQ